MYFNRAYVLLICIIYGFLCQPNTSNLIPNIGNTPMWYFLFSILYLSLHWFFIGYWILKTGLDFYPGPHFFYASSVFLSFDATTFPLINAASTVPEESLTYKASPAKKMSSSTGVFNFFLATTEEGYE